MRLSLFLDSDGTVTSWRLFLVLLILGFGLRLGYGVARYQSNLIRLSGSSFITSWDFDALEHVLIAKALLSGKSYVVDNNPIPQGKHVRHAGEDAVFKAPLYQFFLAGVFAISGFSFLLFFPLQALFGGLAGGFIGLITLETFRRGRAAWLAGLIATAHPILVNSASQPYNENLFFFLFAASIWAFLIGFRTQQLRWFVICGATIGLCTLTRENGVPLLVALAAAGIWAAPRSRKSWVRSGVLTLTTIAVVAPWTARNYFRLGTFVPVASIMGDAFAVGNNECVASESVFTPYWAEGPCLSLNQRRATLEASSPPSDIPAVVRHDRISASAAIQFIHEHPGAYSKLVLRRLWTTLLPYDPRGNQRLHTRIAFVLYWLAIFPAGIAGMSISLKRMETRTILLALIIGLNLLSIMAVYYSADLRYRVGIDLLLGCFAGWYYSEIIRRRAQAVVFEMKSPA